MGKIIVEINHLELNIQRAINECRADNCGAEILFIGTVRNKNEGRPVSAVYYDGHLILGEKVLREICVEAQSQWGMDINFFVGHRLGLLAVGVSSLIIHVTSPHREGAYQSSRYVIEQIKLRLPVWKEEKYCDGDSAWLPGQTLNLF
jgi:molybdopterin synthase catalytic subunit